MKFETMTLTVKRQAVFPKRWCESVGLGNGGPVRVVPVGDPNNSLLITPVTVPKARSVSLLRVLRSCPEAIVAPERHFLKSR